MKKVTQYIIICFMAHIASSQHRPLYNSYLYNELVINPAYAGALDALSVSASYRNQWKGFGNGIETFNFAAHTPVLVKYFATGLLVTQDRFGVTSNTEIMNSYAAKINLKKINIALGGQIGYAHMVQNFGDITTNTPGDEAFSTSVPTGKMIYGYGIKITYNRMFFSYSLPSSLISKSPIEVYHEQQNIYGGYSWKWKNGIMLTPSMMIKYLKASDVQYDLNLLIQPLNFMSLGITYRVNEAIVALAQLKIAKQLRIAYSYEYQLSKINSFTPYGSHEIMLRYDFKYQVNDLNVKTFN